MFSLHLGKSIKCFYSPTRNTLTSALSTSLLSFHKPIGIAALFLLMPYLLPCRAAGGQTECGADIQENSQKESPFLIIPPEIQTMILDKIPKTVGARTPSQVTCKSWNSLQPRYQKVLRLENSKDLRLDLLFWKEKSNGLNLARIPKFDISPNGKYVLIYSNNNNSQIKILIWNTDSGELKHKFTSEYIINDAWFLPDSQQVAIIQSNHDLILWDFENNIQGLERINRLHGLNTNLLRLNRNTYFRKAAGGHALAVDFALGTQTLLECPIPFYPISHSVSATGNKLLFVHDFYAFDSPYKYAYYDLKKKTYNPSKIGSHLNPARITFVKDSAKALVEFVHHDPRLPRFTDPKIFNFKTNKWESTIPLPNQESILFQPSMDGARFFIAYKNGSAQVRNTLSQKILSNFEINQDQLLSAQFSHSADLLVITESHGRARLIDVTTGARIAEIDLQRILRKQDTQEKKHQHRKPLKLIAQFLPEDQAILLFADTDELFIWRP